MLCSFEENETQKMVEKKFERLSVSYSKKEKKIVEATSIHGCVVPSQSERKCIYVQHSTFEKSHVQRS
jgi:hypothetical protein